MGYYMQQNNADFTVKKENVQACLAAIKEISVIPRSWVHQTEALKADTVAKAFSAWRWDVELNEAGDVENIQFEGEKLGDDAILFVAVAPFVEAGSSIEMNGEEGCQWRWVFDGSSCQEVYPTVVWPEMMSANDLDKMLGSEESG